MSYITVRGNLGYNHVRVHGLSTYEVDMLSQILRKGPKTEDMNEIQFLNPVMHVINQLEYSFGYEVVSTTNTLTGGYKAQPVTMWTMCKPPEQYTPRDQYR